MNGTFLWNSEARLSVNSNKMDLNADYLNQDKDYSAELFAIHWWLKSFVCPQVNRLRKIPFIPKSLKEVWNKPNIKKHWNELHTKNLEKLIAEYEVRLKFTQIKYSLDERKDFEELLRFAKEDFLRLSLLKDENEIRKSVCRSINEFLTKENVCSSKTGIHMISAFLVFSSGISFRVNRKGTSVVSKTFFYQLERNFSKCYKPKNQLDKNF